MSSATAPSAPTTIRLRGHVNNLLTDNLPGMTLWVEGTVAYDYATLTADLAAVIEARGTSTSDLSNSSCCVCGSNRPEQGVP